MDDKQEFGFHFRDESHMATEAEGGEATSWLNLTGHMPPAQEQAGHGHDGNQWFNAGQAQGQSRDETQPADALGTNSDDGHLPGDDQYAAAIVTGEGEGHVKADLHYRSALSQTCETLRELQVERVLCIKTVGRINLPVLAKARRFIGWEAGLDELGREAMNKKAIALVKALRKGTSDHGIDDIGPILAIADESAMHWTQYRADTEKEMIRLADTLPAAKWADGVMGFTTLGLAVIVGECGNLSNYATKERLWKRLGLAVLDGVRQGGLKKGASAEDWIKHGYAKQRRGQIYGVIQVPLFMQKQNNGYQANYERHYTAAMIAHPEWGKTPKGKDGYKGHYNNHAQRLMLKDFIEDLWKAWRLDLGQEIPVLRNDSAAE